MRYYSPIAQFYNIRKRAKYLIRYPARFIQHTFIFYTYNQ
ncbi:hypothetical protein HMPREF1585_01471 [Gardnerella vaginalis JCP8481B]|nr:hypothetical protein HMPREF1585_01471 [Gardnerella vaginalis JCP8481B]